MAPAEKGSEAIDVVVHEDYSRDKLASIAHRKSSRKLGDSQDLVVQNMEETPVELIPAIPEQQRLFLEYQHVCAWVSTSFGPPSLLTKATSLATGLFQKKNKEAKPTHRQVLTSSHQELRPCQINNRLSDHLTLFFPNIDPHQHNYQH